MKKFMLVTSFLMLCLMTLLPSVLHAAAGSCTFAVSEAILQGTKYSKFTWVCTSDADGNVSAPTITNVVAATISGIGYDTPMTGMLVEFRITPGTAGDAPTAGFAVQMRKSTDANIDFLRGLAPSCSATVTTYQSLFEGYYVPVNADIATPYASGMGATNKFTIDLYKTQ